MDKQSEHIASLLQRIPQNPGVYQYFNSEGEIIYVGKAKNLHRRVNSYFQKDHQSSNAPTGAHIADIRYVVVDSEQDAFLLENNLIKKYQPHYNIDLKDGKSYPSICITREPYPRIFKTRTINKKWGDYYGPYSFGNTVELMIELIHKLFPIRSCNMPMTRSNRAGEVQVCLKYISNLLRYMRQKVSKEQYALWVTQARKIIRGDGHEISRQIEEEMYRLSAEMKFEEAQREKEKLELLRQFCSKTIITNSSAGDVDVFGYDEQGDNVYISMLHVHNGSIVQGQTIEYQKRFRRGV